ncbi:cytochrome P450 [Sphingomonas sp. Root710]|uniref:cytochrome P450 n=1 Tax=Sphingomonas sp. Root710 TaxID=1736594 RepID=UPI00138F55EB|nr:cytochrome P450 [Sphingomonas sp. Root710]
MSVETLKTGARPAAELAQLDLLSDELRADPYPFFAELLQSAPVLWSERHRAWLISRHEDVTAALKHEAFSSDRIAPYLESRVPIEDRERFKRMFDLLGSMLLFKAAPIHTRLRGLVQKSFTPWRVKALESDVERIATELSEAMLKRLKDGVEHVDLFSEFCAPLPGQVIARMFGVPVEDGALLKSWAHNLGMFMNAALDNPDRNERVAEAMTDLETYLRGHIDAYRQNPADNILSGLVQAADEGDKLDYDELIATCMLLIDAGYKTVQYSLVNGLLTLLQSPSDWHRFASDPAVAQSAVEECIRFAPAGNYIIRRADRDIEFGGQNIQAGSRIFIVTGAANRDPGRFEEPNRFMIDRQRNAHVTFGGGMHFCMGAPLARMEMKAALTTFLRIMPRLELAVPLGSLEWQRVLLLRGLDYLPARLASPDATAH